MAYVMYPGSSPLTRGKLAGQQHGRVGGGLIPAHAGKTQPHERGRAESWAHPRSRGENPASSRYRKTVRGSSPLTRGKHASRHAADARQRLIPAHAGKTTRAATATARRRAHPRSRGENAFQVCHLHFIAGSSPLTRGKHVDVRCPGARGGLIPAHAGKTSRTCAWFPSPWAHPRSRGENAEDRQEALKKMGSSPLTRGKQAGARNGHGSGGLIPAHAGKTSSTCTRCSRTRAHPRSRGENLSRSS